MSRTLRRSGVKVSDNDPAGRPPNPVTTPYAAGRRMLLTWSALQVRRSGSMTGSIPPSQAAEQSGFSLDTLRYYERIGLLDDIGRAPSGHRRFREEDLEWLGVLRCLRDTGMPIAQMRRYAELARCGEPTMTERLALLIEHDAQVGRRIAALQAEQAHLREKIDWYRSQLQTDDA
jgi:DNA-binding transcriptional MerR regulator